MLCGFQSVFLSLISNSSWSSLSHGIVSFIIPIFFPEKTDSVELNVGSRSQSQEMAELRGLQLRSCITRMNSF